MRRKIIQLLCALAIAFNCNAQKTNREIVVDFMESMKNVDSYESLINIPDSLKNSRYMVNFYLVADYHIQEINEFTYEAIFSTGFTEKCISITLEVDTLSNGLLKPGELKYNEQFDKYFIDPWIATRKWCGEKPKNDDSGRFTSLSGHFEGVLPNRHIKDLVVGKDSTNIYEYVVSESQLGEHRDGFLALYDLSALEKLDSIIHDVFHIPADIIISDHKIEWRDYYEGEMKGLKFGSSIMTFVEYESYYAVLVLPDNEGGGLCFSLFGFNPLSFEFEFSIKKDNPDDAWLILDRIDSETIDTVYSGADTLFAGYFESMEPVKFEFVSPKGDSKFIVVNPHSGFKLNDSEFRVPMMINLRSDAQSFGRTLELHYSQE
ncbi:MAG: hypothetical protein WBG42_01240, partial [Cryomorphaceae bacterium]